MFTLLPELKKILGFNFSDSIVFQLKKAFNLTILFKLQTPNNVKNTSSLSEVPTEPLFHAIQKTCCAKAPALAPAMAVRLLIPRAKNQ